LDRVRSLLVIVDQWQRRSRLFGPVYGVIKKSGDDRLNQFVVALGWYGFVAIYPLLLAVVTVFGFIGAADLGRGLVSTLHQFPVVGSQFNPERGSSSLHGSVLGLVVGVIGLVYGAQGVTQTAQQAMAQVWNVPELELPGFLPRLARSLIGLVTIGGAFVINAGVASLTADKGLGWDIRLSIFVGLLLINILLYFAAFRALTPGSIGTRELLPGAVVGSMGFSLLITVGASLVQHQIRHSSATYGQFGIVIGLVGFLFLLAKISLYGAELNPVLARRLWPRAIVSTDPTQADDQVLRDITRQNLRRTDQRIEVGFGEDASDEAALDAQSKSESSQTIT
jgi:uncharacterized BrkB/YihY/UPF0761 family membrane protein